jgi:protein-disulfide isomerase
MLKLLIIISTLNISLSAKLIDEQVYKYEENRVLKNRNIKLNDMKLSFKKKLNEKWYGYAFKINITANKKTMDLTDIVFSNGEVVTSELTNMKTSIDYKRVMHPKLDTRYTQKSKLIAGNYDAAHKLVVFSDPLCPICESVVPDIIEIVRAHPKTYALFYISFPLQMHPTARTLSIASKIATIQGVKEVEYKVYNAQFERNKSTNDQSSLDAFNKALSTNITMNQINNKAMQDSLEEDIKLGEEALVRGTPTLFLDGEIDVRRTKYLEFIK